MAKNPQYHGRAKHIDIKVRDSVSKQSIELKYCQTVNMVADMLTKGLPRDTFEKLRDMAGVQPYFTSSEKECVELHTLHVKYKYIVA